MVTKEFAQAVRDEVERIAGDGSRVTLQETMKNNGLKLTAVCILKEDEKVAPNVYLEGLSEQEDPKAAAEEVLRTVEEYRGAATGQEANIAIGLMQDKERFLKSVLPKVVNFDWNREQLGGIPYRRYLDLAITYKAKVTEAASITVSDGMAKTLGITEQELYDAAMENAKEKGCVIKSLCEVLKPVYEREGIVLPDEAYGIPLCIVSNPECLLGAYPICIGEMLKGISGKIGGDFYLIPSSMHEIIVFPAGDDVNTDNARLMIHEVNRCNVAPEERLSDSLYFYDSKAGELRISD